jgi:hypothetical protein
MFYLEEDINFTGARYAKTTGRMTCQMVLKIIEQFKQEAYETRRETDSVSDILRLHQTMNTLCQKQLLQRTIMTLFGDDDEDDEEINETIKKRCRDEIAIIQEELLKVKSFILSLDFNCDSTYLSNYL